VQFHPELKSTVENPHPIFKGLIKAAMEFKQKGIEKRLSTVSEAAV
jgi:CTP synthase